MNEFNERFGLLIDKLRTEQGLTKTAIGAELDVSQQYISKLTKTGTPSDLFLTALCNRFSVNEEWLRCGNGEMFMEISVNEAIADFMADLLREEEPSFRKRFIEVFAALDPDDWKYLEGIAEKIVNKG